MTKTKNYLILTMGLMLTLIVQSNFAVAQSLSQLEEHQKSVGLVDIRVDQLIKDSITAGVEAEMIDKIELDGPFRNVKPSEIERVFGAFCFPENLETAMAAMAGPPKDGFPVEFFVRFKFKNAESVKKLEGFFSGQSATVKLADGKEYYTPKAGPEHRLFFARRVDETMFELGTEDYVVQSKRNFFTDRLKTAFAAAPKESVRVVVDLETRRELLRQAAEMGKKNLDPISSAYLDLIDNAKSLAITSSVSSENLFSVIVDANNNSDAEELAEGINGLLGTAKIGFGAMFGEMTRQSPPEMKDSLQMVKGIVDNLAATQSNATVNLFVRKPEGFAEKVAEFQRVAAAQAKKMTRVNEFRQLALGVHNYESANRKFPFNNAKDSAISWRGKILPYIEFNNTMSGKLDLDKGTKEAQNSKFAKKMPEIFGAGGKNSNVSWIKSTVEGFGSITDGSSNTIMLIENPIGGPWLEDNSLTIDEAVKLVTGLADGKELIVAFYDGSCTRISNRIPEKTLRNLFDPRDGNVTDQSWQQR